MTLLSQFNKIKLVLMVLKIIMNLNSIMLLIPDTQFSLLYESSLFKITALLKQSSSCTGKAGLLLRWFVNTFLGTRGCKVKVLPWTAKPASLSAFKTLIFWMKFWPLSLNLIITYLQIFTASSSSFMGQQGVPRQRDVISPPCPGFKLGLPQGLLLGRHAQKTSPTRRPRGILVRCRKK